MGTFSHVSVPFDCCVLSLCFPYWGFILEFPSNPDTNWSLTYFILVAHLSRFVSVKKRFSFFFVFLSYSDSPHIARLSRQQLSPSIWQNTSTVKKKNQHSKKWTSIQYCPHSPLNFITHFRYKHSLIHKPWQAVIYWN